METFLRKAANFTFHEIPKKSIGSFLLRGFSAFLVCLLLSAFVHSDDASSVPTVLIATEEYQPFVGSQLKGQGLMASIVREAFKRERVNVNFRFLEPSRGFELAREGDFDATFPWAHRAERTGDFFYSVPLLESDIEYIYFLKSKSLTWDYKKPDFGLPQGKTIGALAGYNYGPLFLDAENKGVFEVERVTTLDQLFQLIFAGRIDAIISQQHIANYHLKSHYSSEERLGVTAVKALDEPVEYDYLLIPKKSPHALYFLNAFNRGMASLHKDGTYDRLITEHLNEMILSRLMY
jgi:polar amino acid transport system substrate-binding protein